MLESLNGSCCLCAPSSVWIECLGTLGSPAIAAAASIAFPGWNPRLGSGQKGSNEVKCGIALKT